MGGSSSTPYMRAYKPHPIASMKSACETERISSVHPGAIRRRNNILQRATTSNADNDFIELMHSENNFSSDKSAEKLLRNAIHGFFFLESDNEMVVNLILKALRRETFGANTVVVSEGDEGSKLYILQSGQVEVTIRNEVIRRMESGALFGELALLYEAPRSATVQCVSDCVLWSLERDIYQTIQRNTTSAALKKKCQWLSNCPELANIGSLQMSRLLQMLHKQDASQGQVICHHGDISEHVILVESGKILIELPAEFDQLETDIDDLLGIVRPPYASHNPVKKATSVASTLTANVICIDESYTLHEGCIVGMHVAKAHTAKATSGKWEYSKGRVTCPVTLVAMEDTQYSLFPVDFLERLLPIGLNESSVVVSNPGQTVSTKSPNKYMHFTPSKMRLDHMLGQGGYGTVLMGYYDQDPEPYAVKLMSKVAIINNGHVQHVSDERSLLASFTSPFILKLYGSYQTPDAVALVSEYLDRGDLWSVIYENPKYGEKGLSPALVRFYTTSIVLALAHIHEKNVAFRDLKPENIMIDSRGYIRLIDFGFAKKLPYEDLDADGNWALHYKAHTLCGTPEYLAPEFIFSNGNDHGVDIWALGIIIHEMYMLKTPFLSIDKPEDMQLLFTTIANVKATGKPDLDPRLDDKDKSMNARDLMTRLLAGEPSNRIGYSGYNTRTILDHPFFTASDIAMVENGTYKPRYIPVQRSRNVDDDEIDMSKKFESYSGINDMFQEF